MNILIDIGHPAHVHLFKNLYFELTNRGHRLLVTVKLIPEAIKLLDFYKINYINIGKKPVSIKKKIIKQLWFNFKILSIVKKNKIDLGIGTSFSLAHVSKISKMKSIILDDDDDDVEPLFVKYAHNFCDTLLSPEVLKGKRKRTDTIFYRGFHELAYLHPNRFMPDSSVLKEIGLAIYDDFFVLRFNAFRAYHDKGVYGLSSNQKKELIKMLEPKGKIFISSEGNIEPEFKKFQLKLSFDKIHSLLYYAKLFITDSQTMASEAAILGTPTVRLNSLVGKLTYLEYEEQSYKMVYNFKPQHFEKLVLKVNELIGDPKLKIKFNERRIKFIKNHIDVTSFLVWFIENYPNSVKVMKENHTYQDKFIL
jgi:predicted glycosyltransferase